MGFVAFTVFILIGAVVFVSSTGDNPNSPKTLDVITSERLPTFAQRNQDSEAGNITTMNITGWTQTMTWQGFVGNVSGRIVLDDAENKSLYDWTARYPQGEVYAVNTSGAIDWSSIRCFEFENETTINLTIYEAMLGLKSNDYDGVDETFNLTNHAEFWVGTHTIPQNSCPSTFLYVNDARQTDVFRQVLLTDKTHVIYTALIEDDDEDVRGNKAGFDGNFYDYQMLVGVDGHNGKDSIWKYYFYVELE
jgi:hypothetical protein